MTNFKQFWDKHNGELYKDVPPPVKYDMADYGDAISSGGTFGNTETGGHELRPIAAEDMARYAHDDVVDFYTRHHGDKSPTRLGGQMTDGQFKKFMGHTW